MSPHTRATEEQAGRLLFTLHYLLRAVRNGGQVSELHLGEALDGAVALLAEVGGFDAVLGRYD